MQICRHCSVLFLTMFMLSGCGDGSTSPTPPSVAAIPRRITLTAHLDGNMESDPALFVGEQIVIIPDADEPFENHGEVHISLPDSTPYAEQDEVYWLHGYAVGQSSAANAQFAAHSNTSQAKRNQAWKDGWLKGFTDREQQKNSTIR